MCVCACASWNDYTPYKYFLSFFFSFLFLVISLCLSSSMIVGDFFFNLLFFLTIESLLHGKGGIIILLLFIFLYGLIADDDDDYYYVLVVWYTFAFSGGNGAGGSCALKECVLLSAGAIWGWCCLECNECCFLTIDMVGHFYIQVVFITFFDWFYCFWFYSAEYRVMSNSKTKVTVEGPLKRDLLERLQCPHCQRHFCDVGHSIECTTSAQHQVKCGTIKPIK